MTAETCGRNRSGWSEKSVARRRHASIPRTLLPFARRAAARRPDADLTRAAPRRRRPPPRSSRVGRRGRPTLPRSRTCRTCSSRSTRLRRTPRRARGCPVTGFRPAVRERRRHHREVAAVDQQRTLSEVEVDGHRRRRRRACRSSASGRRARGCGRRRPARTRAPLRSTVEPTTGEAGETRRGADRDDSSRRRSSRRAGGDDRPALTMGLNGRFVASTEIALNALPDGSTPTRSITFSRPCCSSASPNTNGFEIDWIVNSCRLSPTS